jgi:bifunctional aspartokinase / homoserine dehydrogenase 1
MQTITMKFGGTSVGSPEAIAQAAEIIRSTRKNRSEGIAVVVSAMRGVTDAIQQTIEHAASGANPIHHGTTEKLLLRHQQVAENLLGREAAGVMSEIEAILAKFSRICDSVAVLGEVTPRALDYTMGMGERMNARLVAGALRNLDVQAQALEATELIVTDDHFQTAVPLMDLTQKQIDQVLPPLLNQGIVPVITGFISATSEKIPTTLGRGGSDFSAALIGACLKSEEVWIWTDVNGVMSADPRIVPAALSIETLTYREVGELAYFGAKVLHPKTIRPVVEAGIPLRVKNTFNPSHPGTQIVARGTQSDGAIKAVTTIPDLSMITVEGKGMLGVPGIAARTFGAVAKTDTSVLLISQASSEQSISFVVPQNSAENVVGALEAEFELELGRRDIDQIWSQGNITILTVVGAGMRATPGIAGKVFTATGQKGINVIAIAQGSSECSISLTVDADQGEAAVRAIHSLILAE